MTTKKELRAKKENLEKQLIEVEKELKVLENLEKPYVANVSSYSGHGSMQFKTEVAARKKLDEYFGKTRFKNGLNYGVYLYKHNDDGTKTMLEVRPKGRKDFSPTI